LIFLINVQRLRPSLTTSRSICIWCHRFLGQSWGIWYIMCEYC
jgi:hypothetical protein